MPDLFDYQYGELGAPSTDAIWNQWAQGTLGGYDTPLGDQPVYQYDENNNLVEVSLGYNEFGIPDTNNLYAYYDESGNLIEDPWGFQQFMPEGMSFMEYMQSGGMSDAMANTGQQSYDWYSYSSPGDELSGLSQDQLAQVLGEYGFEYLEGMDVEAVQAALEAAGGVDALGALFAEQYGGAIPEWSSEGLNLQADVYAAQEASMWAAYADWETSQMGILQEELEQLGLNYLTGDYNQLREYQNTISNLSDSEADFIRSQIQSTKGMRSQQGRSGLSGGTLGGRSNKAMQSIANQLDQIQFQKNTATTAYQLGVDNASDLYQMSAGNLVTGFQTSQANQIASLEDSIEALVSQFELTAGQAYSDWYVDLIDQMADLDIYTPDITVGEDIFEWNPFGIGVGNEEAVGYDAYACAEGQHWDFEISDCVADAE